MSARAWIFGMTFGLVLWALMFGIVWVTVGYGQVTYTPDAQGFHILKARRLGEGL